LDRSHHERRRTPRGKVASIVKVTYIYAIERGIGSRDA
jgi:hypothetical protein